MGFRCNRVLFLFGFCVLFKVTKFIIIFYEFIFLLCVLFVFVVVDLQSHVFEIIYEISGICFQMVLHTPHLKILIHQVNLCCCMGITCKTSLNYVSNKIYKKKKISAHDVN